MYATSLHKHNPLRDWRGFLFAYPRNGKYVLYVEREMHNEEDPAWGLYSAACMKNLTKELAAKIRNEVIAEIAVANATERVFTHETGGKQIRWKWGHGTVEPCRDVFKGWREMEDGTREEVFYYYGEGWMSRDELFKERQLFPRIAP